MDDLQQGEGVEMRGKIHTGLLVAAGAWLALVGQAAAQSADRAADRADSRQRRIDRLIEAEAKPLGVTTFALDGSRPREPSLTLTFAAPVSRNTNIEHSDTDRKEAGHVAPSVTLDWSHKVSETTTFSLRAGADLDVYSKFSENDAATLTGRAKFGFADTVLGGVAKPYAQYSLASAYAGTFAEHDVDLHTFTLGANRDFALSDDVELSADLSVARREASKAVSEQNRATLVVGVSGSLSETIGWSIEQTVQARSYTGSTNKGRDDWNFATAAALSFEISDTVSADLTLQYEANTSDVDGRDYEVWDGGAAFTLTRRF